jgi:hypothetical protein
MSQRVQAVSRRVAKQEGVSGLPWAGLASLAAGIVIEPIGQRAAAHAILMFDRRAG